MNEPTHLDLFSGIGGFSIAAEWAGFRTIAFVEKNPDRQQILERFWPGIPIFSSVETFGGRGFECDLLTGGFPCQPFSTAGKRRGKADDRYLWPDMLRIIQATKPRWIVGENVTGLDGLGLDECISDLEAVGYEVAPPLEIPACSVGAPHGRPRIWIVANAINDGRPQHEPARRREWSAPKASQDGIATNTNGGQRENGRIHESNGRRERIAGEAEACGATSNANSVRQLQSQGSKPNERRRPLYISHEVQWAEDWPDRLSALCGMDDGVSRRLHEAKAPGNAIVPQVAYQIIKAIKTEIDKAKG